jgi:hypothetical protein
MSRSKAAIWPVVVILVCVQCLSAAPPLRQFSMADPVVRQQRVEGLREIAEQRKARVLNYARLYNFPVRWKVGRTIFEIMDVDQNRIRINRTNNSNAAIAIGVKPIQQSAPYYLDGTGQVIGIWDGGAILSSHQELTGRVTVIDNVESADHATHVAGTVIASGVNASAKGMAPAGMVDSYDWNSDESEVVSRAMVTAGESGAIQISNHSYSFVHGWEHDYDPPRWSGAWQGEPTIESDMFGQYSSYTRSWDQICYDAPYYLKVDVAGNDRNDSAPAAGATFEYYNLGAWRTASYDAAIHPKADGWDNGGYDTISTVACAKNTLSVGAVTDAVSSGQRDPSKATMASFSCWGPTDDGRIKPDIVTNGVGQYSSLASSNSSYASWSGTSMAAPCATGAASLLLEHYTESFPGQYMLAATLKGLILHAADDLGNPGPDYRFGFGLMNTQAAADIITNALNFTALDILTEDALTTSQITATYHIDYDGSGPIKATLCWTDPPGPSQSGLDNTTSVLVNDLDLRIIDADGTTVYMPYLLTPASPSTAATTGDNSLDNVEQVEIVSPTTIGTYTVEVSYKGSLTNSVQDFSLITTGNSLVASPPIASEVNESTLVDIPVTITLSATDDGLPNQPGVLNYIITTLPNNGFLSDPASGNITSVPYTLASNGNQVTFTPLAAYLGSSSFQYMANDGGIAPDGGDSNIAAVSIDIGAAPEYIYSADMDSNPGWTLEGGWAWGTPAGGGGSNGNADPSSGFTGSNVIGYNPSGDYGRIKPAEWATTPAIDCTGKTGVTLSFYRWLNVGDNSSDHAYIEVNNGTGWESIWGNTTEITDDSWIFQTFDISMYADNEPSVYIRWGMGETNPRHNYSGWNIDDVVVTGDGASAKYILTTSSTSGGSVNTPGEGTFQYDSGSAVNLDAAADPTYHFVNWTGTAVDAGKVANPSSVATTVTIDSDYTVKANFAIDTFTLEYATGTGGTLSGDISQVVAYGGDGTAVTATPDTDYHFLQWSDSSTENPRTDVNVSADINVTANFAPNTVTISGYVKNPCDLPIEDVYVQASSEGSSDMTDSNGYYEILVDYDWSGTVTPSKQNYTLAPDTIEYTSVLSDKTNQDYIATNIYDLNCDGSIEIGDLMILAGNWLLVGSDTPGDFYKDQDNIVNLLDFTALSSVWGQ